MYEILDFETLQAVASFDYFRQAMQFLRSYKQKAFILNVTGCPITCNF
jgi:hypothetical protein